MKTTFHIKVSILEGFNIHKFYIKQQVENESSNDSHAFESFKNSVLKREPIVNQPDIKFYWIDLDNDKILVSCEEDFLIFLDQCKGTKIFIKIPDANKPTEEEKKVRKRTLKKTKSENLWKKPETKSKKCAKICKLFSSIDPANLCESSTCDCCRETKNVINGCNSMSDYHVSPEAIRILSNTISDCMKPCHYINTVLTEITSMFSQIDGGIGNLTPSTSTSNVTAPAPDLINLTIPQETQKVEILEPKVTEIVLPEIQSAVVPVEDEKVVEIDLTTSENVPEVSEDVINVDEVDKVITKSPSIESLSSVEICGSNSNVDEDSRDWTILDAMHESENDEKSEDEPFFEVNGEDDKGNDVEEQVQEATNEQQVQTDPEQISDTFPSVEQKIFNIQEISFTSAKDVTTSSIVDETPEITEEVKKSSQIEEILDASIEEAAAQVEVPPTPKVVVPEVTPTASNAEFIWRKDPLLSMGTSITSISSSSAQSSVPSSASEVKSFKYDHSIRYHHNKKINDAIHRMIQMGYDNEGFWLTQLMENLGGDVSEAVNFLAPNGK